MIGYKCKHTLHDQCISYSYLILNYFSEEINQPGLFAWNLMTYHPPTGTEIVLRI